MRQQGQRRILRVYRRPLPRAQGGRRFALGRGGWLALGLLALLMVAIPIISSPTYAASVTVRAHPVLNSGPFSKLREEADWRYADITVVRVTSMEFGFSGNNVTSVTVNLTRNTTGWRFFCYAYGYVRLFNSAGQAIAQSNYFRVYTLGIGSSFSATVDFNNAVAYHRIYRARLYFTSEECEFIEPM